MGPEWFVNVPCDSWGDVGDSAIVVTAERTSVLVISACAMITTTLYTFPFGKCHQCVEIAVRMVEA